MFVAFFARSSLSGQPTALLLHDIANGFEIMHDCILLACKNGTDLNLKFVIQIQTTCVCVVKNCFKMFKVTPTKLCLIVFNRLCIFVHVTIKIEFSCYKSAASDLVSIVNLS